MISGQVSGQVPVTLRRTSQLTSRQRQIFDLIVVGRSNKEIARSLCLSEGTVKIHIAKLFEKLSVRHRSAVALAGAKMGLHIVTPLLAQAVDGDFGRGHERSAGA